MIITDQRDAVSFRLKCVEFEFHITFVFHGDSYLR